MNNSVAEVECCPRFNPEPWDEKMQLWENKRFIKDRVFTLFNIPVNFPRVIKRMMASIENAGSASVDWMGLSEQTSKWNMNLFVAVDNEVPGVENVTISGKYFSKVYEGPFKESGKWVADFSRLTSDKELKTGKKFMWYTTCPKCARKYGKNYVVAFGEII